MPDWYECVEPEVRPLVKYLRDNGFNTTCSCGHEMLIQVACDAEDLTRLWNLLAEHLQSTDDFELAFYWHSWCRFAEVRLRMPDGKLNDGWRGRRDWAGKEYCSPGDHE